MPFQAWILAGTAVGIIMAFALQWGHALSGMDTILTAPNMVTYLKLQWGHALSGMDTSNF